MRGAMPVWVAAAALACGGQPDGERGAAARGAVADESRTLVERAAVERALDDGLDAIMLVADSVDRLFRPVPLLTPAQEAVFRRYGNDQQLARARALGVRAAGAAERQEALRAGRLLVLEDSTALWVVRELTHSEPLVTPDAHVLLSEVAQRFQARLQRLGAPPFRLEVTSVLRTAEAQAELRRTNPNAAAGQSTHEYGTTLDIAYSSYAAPAAPGAAPSATPDFGPVPDDLSWLQPRLERMAAAVFETVAARNSRELQAILGQVMIEVQSEGLAMVTLERLQPVYHFTVARRLAGR
jgi:hypothetical protein